MRNRMFNATNPWQGNARKVLCVCSAGLLRSPTAARVLAEEYGYNTRAAGIDVGHALIPVDQVLLYWADEIVCMNKQQLNTVIAMTENMRDKEYVNLDVPDSYGYMDPDLVALIKERYAEARNNVHA